MVIGPIPLSNCVSLIVALPLLVYCYKSSSLEASEVDVALAIDAGSRTLSIADFFIGDIYIPNCIEILDRSMKLGILLRLLGAHFSGHNITFDWTFLGPLPVSFIIFTLSGNMCYFVNVRISFHKLAISIKKNETDVSRFFQCNGQNFKLFFKNLILGSHCAGLRKIGFFQFLMFY